MIDLLNQVSGYPGAVHQMKNNLVQVRAEVEARPHVRNAVQGAG